MALSSIHESELTVSRPANNQNYTVGQSWEVEKLGKGIELQRSKATIPK